MVLGCSVVRPEPHPSPNLTIASLALGQQSYFTPTDMSPPARREAPGVTGQDLLVLKLISDPDVHFRFAFDRLDESTVASPSRSETKQQDTNSTRAGVLDASRCAAVVTSIVHMIQTCVDRFDHPIQFPGVYKMAITRSLLVPSATPR